MRHLQLAWHPNGRRVACAAGANILIYAVDEKKAEPYASPDVVASVGTALCIVADASAILIGGGGPDVPNNAALYSWAGELLHTIRLLQDGITSSASLPSLPAATCTCICLFEHSDSLTLAAVVATPDDASTAQATLIHSADVRLANLFVPPAATAVGLPATGVTCVALSGSKMAVGCSDGAVRILACTSGSATAQEAAGYPPVLSLQAWGYDTGGVSCLAFAADGATLAVGYLTEGAAVFGHCGTLVGRWPLRCSGLALSGEGLARGTGAIAWAPGEAHVLAAARVLPHSLQTVEAPRVTAPHALVYPHPARDHFRPADDDVAACMWRLGMLREPRPAGQASAAGASSIILLGEDHVRLALTGNASSGGHASSPHGATWSPNSWRALTVPRSYLHRAWPLQLAALSTHATSVAVAGSRGVAVAPLNTERWRFLGASAAQVTPFRALFVEWLSDEALLVVGHNLPPTAHDPRAPATSDAAAVSAAATTPADGSWTWYEARQGDDDDDDDGTATADDGENDDDENGGVDAMSGSPRKLCVLVMRADLREVLFRTVLNTPCPRAPPWGCAVLVADADAAHRGRYGLPPAASIIIGAVGTIVEVRLSVPELPAADDAFSSLRCQVDVGGVVHLPPTLGASPAGLSAVHATRGGGAEVVIPLDDGSVLVAALPLGGSGVSPPVRTVLPPGSATRCWQGPSGEGTLWTLNGDGLRQWPTEEDPSGAPPTPAVVLPPPREVTPVALLPTPRAVLGVAFLPVPEATAPLGPRVHVQPFTHVYLRQLLLDGRSDEAARLARTTFFRRRHCLELLLHEALLEASALDRRARARPAVSDGPVSPATKALFGQVATLVRSLASPEWMRIVASCARKTDADNWPRLFADCGQPSEILVRSLDAGEPTCAAAMLLPLRAQSGVAACEHAVGLVRAAADARGMRKLIRQLDGFAARAPVEEVHVEAGSS